MPGIAGIIGAPGNRESLILRMTEQMKHEDFYSIDSYVDENIALGISSVIPENKILFNETRTIAVLLDGEVFGLSKIKTDAKAILNLYEKGGIQDFDPLSFLSNLDGWFTLVIYDSRNGSQTAPTIFLITDRYGFKPMYYTEIESKFVFASELKSILAYPDFNKTVDPAGVAEFALFNYPLGDNTFVKNIKRVPPASIWKFNVRTGASPTLTKKNYWEFSTLLKIEPLPSRAPELNSWLEQCGHVFRKVVNNLMKDDREVGLTLTAGYDTRAILSVLKSSNKIGPRLKSKVKCLTFGSRSDIQTVIASKLAQITHCPHCVEEFGADFVEQLDNLLYRTVWITDGLSNIVHSGWFYVFNKLNKNGVYFLGFGGSELIRGLQNIALNFSYNSQKLIMSKTPQETWFNIVNQENSYGFFSYDFLKESVANSQFPALISHFSINERALYFTLFEIFRKYYCANALLIGSQVRVRLPYITHEFISFILCTPYSILHTRQFSHNPFERLRGQRLSASIIKYNAPELLTIPTDRGYKPYWNLYWYGYPIIFWHQMRRRLFVSAIPELPLMREKVKKIIDEIVEVPCSLRGAPTRNYYNIPKLKEIIGTYPNWNPLEWQELLKVATFELWLRQFIY